jgi:hypothetical protein
MVGRPFCGWLSDRGFVDGDLGKKMPHIIKKYLPSESLFLWRIACVGALVALVIVFCFAKSPMLKTTVTEIYQNSLLLVSIAFSVIRLVPLFDRKAIKSMKTQSMTFCCLTLLYGYVLSRFVYFIFA